MSHGKRSGGCTALIKGPQPALQQDREASRGITALTNRIRSAAEVTALKGLLVISKQRPTTINLYACCNCQGVLNPRAKAVSIITRVAASGSLSLNAGRLDMEGNPWLPTLVGAQAAG